MLAAEMLNWHLDSKTWAGCKCLLPPHGMVCERGML